MNDKPENVKIITELMNKRMMLNMNSNNNRLVNETMTNKTLSHDYEMLLKEIRDVNELWEVNPPESVYSSKKFIGKIITLIKRVSRKLISWYINPVVHKQKLFNASATRCMNGIFQHIRSSYEEIVGLRDSIKQVIEKVNNMENIVTKEFDAIKAFELEIQSKYNELKKEVETISVNVQQNNDNIKAVKELEEKNTEKILYFNNLVEIMKNDNLISGYKRPINIDNVDFENHFRGSEEEIRARMRFYINYFAPGDIVLDIGCGRGEFIELLNEEGISCIGIDKDLRMVELCRTKGLDVFMVDAIEYLSSIPDNHFNGIFLGQVVEHLDQNYLIVLLELIYKKLADKGFLVIETQNPMCLYIYAYGFYIDMSHIRPVHPYTLKYLVESKGFNNILIKLLSPVPEKEQLEIIKTETNSDTDKILNNNFEKLNRLLFSYQDYAIIANKLIKEEI